jgi:hypothetical protein
MNEDWWERPVCWLCDFWWVLLLLLVLLATALFTRHIWLPWLGLSNPRSASPIPSPPATPVFASTPETLMVTSTPIPAAVTQATETATVATEAYGYVNEEGGYALSYPSTWKGIETGANVQFELPDGSNVQITVTSVEPNQTLTSILEIPGPIPTPPGTTTQTEVAGERAIRREIYADGNLAGVVYSLLHHFRLYHLALYAPDRKDLPQDFSQSIQDFEQMVRTFSWLPFSP